MFGQRKIFPHTPIQLLLWSRILNFFFFTDREKIHSTSLLSSIKAVSKDSFVRSARFYTLDFPA